MKTIKWRTKQRKWINGVITVKLEIRKYFEIIKGLNYRYETNRYRKWINLNIYESYCSYSNLSCLFLFIFLYLWISFNYGRQSTRYFEPLTYFSSNFVQRMEKSVIIRKLRVLMVLHVLNVDLHPCRWMIWDLDQI